MHYADDKSMTSISMQPQLHTSCFHCCLAVPAASVWHVEIDHVDQPMCCPGCQAVAQAIVNSGLTSYYSSRQQQPESVAAPLPETLNLYDAP